MNLRLQKYKKNRMLGMGIVNAARAAGYSESYATKKSFRIERQAKVGLADAFERAGLTDKAIVEHALEGLKAMKVVNADVYKDSEGEIDKEKSALREVNDWGSRHKYFESICKMTDRIRDKVELTGKNGAALPTPIINIYGQSIRNRNIPTQEGDRSFREAGS